MSQIRLSVCCLMRALGLCARLCVSICLKCVCVLSCVCFCSLCLISVKKLGHDVCKGACSNYGQLCSLNALPYCTLLLHQPYTHSVFQYTLSLTASSGDLQIYCQMFCAQPSGVFYVHYNLGTLPNKHFGSLKFCLSS